MNDYYQKNGLKDLMSVWSWEQTAKAYLVELDHVIDLEEEIEGLKNGKSDHFKKIGVAGIVEKFTREQIAKSLLGQMDDNADLIEEIEGLKGTIERLKANEGTIIIKKREGGPTELLLTEEGLIPMPPGRIMKLEGSVLITDEEFKKMMEDEDEIK